MGLLWKKGIPGNGVFGGAEGEKSMAKVITS
jgi:hypothetical protein